MYFADYIRRTNVKLGAHTRYQNAVLCMNLLAIYLVGSCIIHHKSVCVCKSNLPIFFFLHTIAINMSTIFRRLIKIFTQLPVSTKVSVFFFFEGMRRKNGCYFFVLLFLLLYPCGRLETVES